MFLALKEINYAKLRYSLIIGIMFLISYVVFILSGLASGLALEFRQAIDNWQAEEVILNADANKVLAASRLKLEDYDNIDSSNKAPLAMFSGSVAQEKTATDKTNVMIFGTESTAFLLPKLTTGRMFAADKEIIIPENLAVKGYDIGQKIAIGSADETYTIVGIFPATSYTVAPVIYTSLETVNSLSAQGQATGTTAINAIVLKKAGFKLNASQKDTLKILSIDELITNIPGYSAQKLTLTAMIYFLFVIIAAIVGIFIYVMTLQKTALFGVMKAQGISNGYIARSIVAQSFIVGLAGSLLALLLAYGSSFLLPAAMPFAILWPQWLSYAVVLLIVAVLGGLFSIGTVRKVDPIKAIGG